MMEKMVMMIMTITTMAIMIVIDIQNQVARFVLSKRRHVSATLLLKTLRWLPVKVRIQFKIDCVMFQ